MSTKSQYTQHQNQYNNEPVYYCTRCLSLKIMSVPGMDNSDYCEDCGGADIASCTIEEWEKKYEEKYGHKFIEGC